MGERPKLSGGIETGGDVSDPGDTATRDEKKDERKSARVQRPIQGEGGNTGQAGKETAHNEK
jgi:hypothetical protein